MEYDTGYSRQIGSGNIDGRIVDKKALLSF
jgi:hypothetical protein